MLHFEVSTHLESIFSFSLEFKGVRNFSHVRYECSSGKSTKFVPSKEADGVALYDPPVPDFSVARITASAAGHAVVAPPVRGSASLCIVTSGRCSVSVAGGEYEQMKRGTVLLLGAGEEIRLRCEGEDEDVVAFQAFC